tara:strand:- start:4440 stop:5654 length:1215 start_codon:yes stop_codon:yes gene_type:complete
MAYDGSGNFARPVSDYVNATVINEVSVNSEMDGIATGLTTAITKDGQTTITANLPMNSKKLTGLAAGGAAGDSVNLGQTQAEAYIWCGTATGTADAVVLSPTPAITAYAAGQRFAWISSSSTNTTAMTLNVSTVGAKAAENNDTALAAGEHEASKMYIGIYDGTAFQIQRFSKLTVAASATASGIVELATTAETETGADAARAVTPDGLHDMTTLSGAAWMLDEDNMASNSAVKVASQQSIKAYADTKTSTLGTEQATTSGTAFDFTGIPAGTKRITIMFNEVSLTGGDPIIVQLGDGGGFEETGYISSGGVLVSGGASGVTSSLVGFAIAGGVAASVFSGIMVLSLQDSAAFTWISSHSVKMSTSQAGFGGGSKSLSAELTQIRITRTGTNTFDAGSINIQYE